MPISVGFNQPQTFVLQQLDLTHAMYAESFQTHVDFDHFRLPIDIYFTNDDPVPNLDDRVNVTYPGIALNSGDDYQYFAFYARPGSVIRFNAEYRRPGATPGSPNALTLIVMTNDQFNNFIKNSMNTITKQLFL